LKGKKNEEKLYDSISYQITVPMQTNIECASSYGSIQTALPIVVKGKISSKQIEGRIGEGNGKLSLKTSYGSIRIR